MVEGQPAATVFVPENKRLKRLATLIIKGVRARSGVALLLAMMGAAGMIAAGIAGPVMGKIYDRYTIDNLPAQVSQVVVVKGKFSPEAVEKLTSLSDKSAVKEALKQGAAMTFRWRPSRACAKNTSTSSGKSSNSLCSPVWCLCLHC